MRHVKRAVHLWAIRAPNLYHDIWGEMVPMYFSSRTSLKNKRYLTNFHCKVKLFRTRDDAEAYYFAKLRLHRLDPGYRIVRMKVWIKDGYYDWIRNGHHFSKSSKRLARQIKGVNSGMYL